MTSSTRLLKICARSAPYRAVRMSASQFAPPLLYCHVVFGSWENASYPAGSGKPAACVASDRTSMSPIHPVATLDVGGFASPGKCNCATSSNSSSPSSIAMPSRMEPIDFVADRISHFVWALPHASTTRPERRIIPEPPPRSA